MSSLGASKGWLEVGKFAVYVTVPIFLMYAFANNTKNLQKLGVLGDIGWPNKFNSSDAGCFMRGNTSVLMLSTLLRDQGLHRSRNSGRWVGNEIEKGMVIDLHTRDIEKRMYYSGFVSMYQR